MSFLSVLGNIGKSALGFVPGGNIINQVLDGVGAVAGPLSAASKGSADQRMGENNQALGYASLGNQQARDTFSSGLAGANYQREGQDRARRMALLSALLGGTQDAHTMPGNPAIAAKMGQSTGGLRPSALSGGHDALLALLGGQADPSAPTYSAPALPQMQQAGGLEKVLGGIGLGGSILGALGRRNQQPPILNSGGGGRP